MRLDRLFRRDAHRDAALSLYNRVVSQAREEGFYRALGVPDTLDGRFEMIALHAFLVLNRLKREGAAATGLGQALFDIMFADLDRGLREMGAGDLGVGRHVKYMVEAFYGRVRAYEQGLTEEGKALETALGRNLYGTATPGAEQLALVVSYVLEQVATLADQPWLDLSRGNVRFSALETGR